MRKDAREVVLKVLYAQNFTGKFDPELFSELCSDAALNEKDIAFATSLLDSVRDNYSQLMEIIGDLAQNYLPERIYVTDRCALLIGLAEMTYFDDVPNIVAIDESLSLCKKYSTENSLSFVNGIFAKYKTMIENT